LILIPFSGYVAETLKVQLLLFPSVVSFGIQAHLNTANRAGTGTSADAPDHCILNTRDNRDAAFAPFLDVVFSYLIQ